jgi:hypothetical protein
MGSLRAGSAKDLFLARDDSLLRDLAAAPRPTGSAAIAAARERCTRELRQLGYEVRERPFAYSQLPGRFATPMFGAVAALLVGFSGALAIEAIASRPP